MSAPVVMSSPSGVFGPCCGKTGPPVTLSPFLVKHVLSAAILVATARKPAGITSGLKPDADLGVFERARAGRRPCKRRPRALEPPPVGHTKTQELTAARRFTPVAVDEQLADVTCDAGTPLPAVVDVPDDVELTALLHPLAFTANTSATTAGRV